MEPTDITIEILKSIRDEVRGVRQELRAELGGVRDELRSELGAVREELKGVGDNVHEMDIRLSTEVVALTGVVRQVGETFRQDRALRARVDEHERRLENLEKRAG